MDKTLEYYNNAAKEYVKDTMDANVLLDLNSFFLKNLPAKAAILDIGCGSGRDSKLFIEKGYTVTAIDGSTEICKLASDYIGQDVICMKFDEIDYENRFDGVWACASILHVPSKDLRQISAFQSIPSVLDNYSYLVKQISGAEKQCQQQYQMNLNQKYQEHLKIMAISLLVLNMVNLKESATEDILLI